MKINKIERLTQMGGSFSNSKKEEAKGEEMLDFKEILVKTTEAIDRSMGNNIPLETKMEKGIVSINQTCEILRKLMLSMPELIGDYIVVSRRLDSIKFKLTEQLSMKGNGLKKKVVEVVVSCPICGKKNFVPNRDYILGQATCFNCKNTL